MRCSIIALLTSSVYVSAQITTPNLPEVTAPAKSLGLGAVCSSTEQCAGNAQCYGTTAFTIKTCGSFNAECASDNDCATNTCQSGTCSGFLATSLYRITTTSAVTSTATPPHEGPGDFTETSTASQYTETNQGALPAPSPTVVAAPGSLPLGAECANSTQCAGGAECFGSNFMVVLRCGNFNAECTTDAQCAFNPCSGGLCRGFLPSSSSILATATATTSAVGYTTPATSMIVVSSSLTSSTGSAAGNATHGTPTISTSPPVATGGASNRGVGSSIAIIAFALALVF